MGVLIKATFVSFHLPIPVTHSPDMTHQQQQLLFSVRPHVSVMRASWIPLLAGPQFVWPTPSSPSFHSIRKKMSGQSKRPSQLENGNQGHSSKKARAQAMPNGLIKQEQNEVGGVREEEKEEEEQEEGEVSQGSSIEGAMVAVEDMETEPQIDLRFRLSLFHCRACHQPLKPPTFKVRLLRLISSSSRRDRRKYFICLQEDLDLSFRKRSKRISCSSSVSEF